MREKDPIIMLLVRAEEYCQRQIKNLMKECEKLAAGRLIINKQAKGIVFYQHMGGVRRGISGNKDVIHQLARRKFNQERVREYEIVLEGIGRIVKALKDKDWISALEEKYQAGGLEWCRIAWSEAQYKRSGKQSENPFRREDLIYVTAGGVKVRTKSELFWAELFERLGIPYAYERKITLDVTNMPDVKGAIAHGGRLYKDYYPDFTLFLADGRILIHEHLGLVHQAEYREKVAERIIAMTSSGFINTDELLLTYEGDVQNMERFLGILERKVIPFV